MSFHGNACKYNCNTNKLLLCTMKGWAWLSFATHISGRGRIYEFVLFLSHLWLVFTFVFRAIYILPKLTQRSVPQLMFLLVRTVLFYWFCMVLVSNQIRLFRPKILVILTVKNWVEIWSTRWLWCTWNLESLELFGFEKFKFLTSLGLEHSSRSTAAAGTWRWLTQLTLKEQSWVCSHRQSGTGAPDLSEHCTNRAGPKLSTSSVESSVLKL